VAGVEERRVDARRDLPLLAVVDRVEVGDGSGGVLGRVERLVEIDLDLRRLGADGALGVAGCVDRGASRRPAAELDRNFLRNRG